MPPPLGAFSLLLQPRKRPRGSAMMRGEHQDGLFPVDIGSGAPSPTPAGTGVVSKDGANEGKRSIRYIREAVLEFGKVSGVADLLDRVALLCATTRYLPYSALLILLQRPAAT